MINPHPPLLADCDRAIAKSETTIKATRLSIRSLERALITSQQAIAVTRARLEKHPPRWLRGLIRL